MTVPRAIGPTYHRAVRQSPPEGWAGSGPGVRVRWAPGGPCGPSTLRRANDGMGIRVERARGTRAGLLVGG